MKAWRVEHPGGAANLVRRSLPVCAPGPMQVRVRVEAVALNHLDLWVRNGVPGHQYPLPLTPGCDIAGVIDLAGPGAEHAVTVGAPVVVSPGVSCGTCEACLADQDPLCPQFGILGETRDGGCADYVVVPLANLIPRPATLDAVNGAALGIAFLTAWSMLVRKAALRAGETVLIQSGGSGVSSAAIQIAKFLGATVITTVGSDEKAARALALGADHVINYKTTSFREDVRRLMRARNRKGVEVALDHVGGETFEESLKCLAWGGRIATCGSTGEAKVNLDLRHVFFKNISILGTTMGSKKDLVQIVQLAAEGKLRAVVDSVFPMDQYPEALARLESRAIFGKVVIDASAGPSTS